MVGRTDEKKISPDFQTLNRFSRVLNPMSELAYAIPAERGAGRGKGPNYVVMGIIFFAYAVLAMSIVGFVVSNSSKQKLTTEIKELRERLVKGEDVQVLLDAKVEEKQEATSTRTMTLAGIVLFGLISFWFSFGLRSSFGTRGETTHLAREVVSELDRMGAKIAVSERRMERWEREQREKKRNREPMEVDYYSTRR